MLRFGKISESYEKPLSLATLGEASTRLGNHSCPPHSSGFYFNTPIKRVLNVIHSPFLHLDLRFPTSWSFQIADRRLSAKSPSLPKLRTDCAGAPNILFLVHGTGASFLYDSISFFRLPPHRPELPDLVPRTVHDEVTRPFIQALTVIRQTESPIFPSRHPLIPSIFLFFSFSSRIFSFF